MDEFQVRTTRRIEIVDITPLVEERVKGGDACLVFTTHATAALIVNEFEPNIKSDYEKFFSMLAKGEWKHNAIDNNAEAHLLSALISPSIVLPVKNGRLELGTWQSIMLVELDGPRTRRVIVGSI